jgi:hypothetical protein
MHPVNQILNPINERESWRLPQCWRALRPDTLLAFAEEVIE